MSEKDPRIEHLNKVFLSTSEALACLQISKQGFYSLILRGKITRIKKGSAVLFFRDEIEKRKEISPLLRKKYGAKK